MMLSNNVITQSLLPPTIILAVEATGHLAVFKRDAHLIHSDIVAFTGFTLDFHLEQLGYSSVLTTMSTSPVIMSRVLASSSSLSSVCTSPILAVSVKTESGPAERDL